MSVCYTREEKKKQQINQINEFPSHREMKNGQESTITGLVIIEGVECSERYSSD